MNTLTLIINRFNSNELNKSKLEWLEEIKLLVENMIFEIRDE